MPARDVFNQILKARAEWEKTLGAPTAAQWADWAMNILARPGLNRLAVATGAAALVMFAWNKFREQQEGEMDGDRDNVSWRLDVYVWLAPMNTLLDPDAPAVGIRSGPSCHPVHEPDHLRECHRVLQVREPQELPKAVRHHHGDRFPLRGSQDGLPGGAQEPALHARDRQLRGR